MTYCKIRIIIKAVKSMRNIRQYFSQKFNVFIFFALSFLLFAFSLFPFARAKADKLLRFNFMSGDHETLLMKNDTQGTSDWIDPIIANAGDDLRFNVYYHCGWDVPEWPVEKARDTKIRITFPSELKNEIQTTGRLWATNVSAITDIGVVQVSSSQKLIFGNTAKWHHEGVVDTINVNVEPNYTEADIGDNPCDCFDCYNHAGSVIFSAKVSEIFPPPTVDIKANNSDGPVTVAYRDRNSLNLSWTSTNADSCTASGDWSGSKAISGSQTISLSQVRTYTFTLTCQNNTSGNSASDSVQVTLLAPGAPVVVTKGVVVTY